MTRLIILLLYSKINLLKSFTNPIGGYVNRIFSRTQLQVATASATLTFRNHHHRIGLILKIRFGRLISYLLKLTKIWWIIPLPWYQREILFDLWIFTVSFRSLDFASILKVNPWIWYRMKQVRKVLITFIIVISWVINQTLLL